MEDHNNSKEDNINIEIESDSLETQLEEDKKSKSNEKPKKEHRSKVGAIICLLVGILLGAGILYGVNLFMKKDEPKTSETASNSCTTIDGVDCGFERVSAVLLNENDLALKFLKMHNEKQNIVYSPLSIRYALSMLREGAKGETKDQLDEVLGEITPKKYQNVENVLGLANALWVKEEEKDIIHSEYKDLLESKYGAEIKYDAFANPSNINNWISDKTFGMLHDTIDEIDSETYMYLINALAIDMEWENKFEVEDTDGMPFYESGTYENIEGDYEVTMMNMYVGRDSFAYNFAEKATVLAMDLKEYGDTTLQFVAIMPVGGLNEFTENTTVSELDVLLNGLRKPGNKNSDVRYSFSLHIPKFKIEDGGLENFTDDLKGVGLADIFDKKSDFSGITDDEEFMVEEAIHDVLFDFSEEGIKAAAVTVLAGGRGAAAPTTSVESVSVMINKPFMFLVRDKNSGDIWFIGNMYQPNKWADDQALYQ